MNHKTTYQLELEELWKRLKKVASSHGDDLILLTALQIRTLNEQLDFLFSEHEKFFFMEDPATHDQRMHYCNLIMERIDILVRHRRTMLDDFTNLTKHY